MFLRVLFLISALCMTGCAGAGGYNDLAPKVIHYGSPTTMQIELYK